MKYIDPIIENEVEIDTDKKITYWYDKFQRKWTYFYYKGKITNYIISDCGDLFNLKFNKFCLKNRDLDGHNRCSLMIDSKLVHVRVNRAVMMSFHPIKNAEKYVVNHLNGIPYDDREEVMQWTNDNGNHLHALETGLYDYNPFIEDKKKVIDKKSKREREIYELLSCGLSVDEVHKLTGYKKVTISRINNDNSNSNYSEVQIRTVLELLCSGVTQKKASEITGVTFREIRHLLSGESWPYIVCEYQDRLPRNKPVPKEIKNKFAKFIEEGKSFNEIINILNLENNRRTRYYYECGMKIFKEK